MTDKEYREMLEKVIETNERIITSSTKDIERYNKELAEQRKIDREMVEYIWSKGVVDEFEMEIYNKNYQSKETKEIIKRRAFEYRFRKSLERHNKKYKEYLAQ